MDISKGRLNSMVELAFAILVITLIPYAFIACVALLFGRKQVLKKNYSYRPKVSVFLPTFNEERNIARKLDDLLQQTYPIFEILVYDCSTDNTARIIETYQKKYNNIKLIKQQERIGMARTLNEALKEAKGEIIIKTDCDSLTKSPNALKELVADFSDKTIGGVSGVCANKGLEGYFRSAMTRLQIAESNLDSTIIAHATSLLAYRQVAVVDVDPNSLNDDAEEFVLIRKRGYKTVIDALVVSEEEIPETFRKRRLQKDRRAAGTIKVLLQNLSVFLNPKFGLYGLVVFPIDLFLLVVSPILLIGISILLGYILFTISAIMLVPYLFLISSIFVFYMVKKVNWLGALVDLQL
ncbi:MAG: glycosyltransferase, partial [Candidatus Bathyarchaeota archaeon]|nr:glycosyltransferase [Candidatus Bathyarchaeota archaeon]